MIAAVADFTQHLLFTAFVVVTAPLVALCEKVEERDGDT